MSVSVVIVAYESGSALERCLRSIHDDAPEVEVIVVDNGGGDRASVEAVRHERLRLVEPGRNLGFAGGCNAGAAEATSDVLVFLNPDTVVGAGSLRRLAGTLEDQSIGIAMARLRLLDRPELLNSSGNVVHISGLAWAGGYGEPADDVSEMRDVPYPSGAAMAMKAAVFRELGGFTEELFMYEEDLDLGWRARLRGMRVVITPAADVYHDYHFGRNPEKRYLIDRNRLVFVLSAYSFRLLLLVAPVLVAVDLGLLALAIKERWAGKKLKAWWWCVAHVRWLWRNRREMQKLRRLPDRVLAEFLTPVLDPRMVSLPRMVRPANWLMERYWNLVRRAL